MRSSDLGKLFESASSKVLDELFKCWGYETVDYKIQNSGTQHGFDIFFKLSAPHARLNVFVECKASNTYNTLDARELTRKTGQLSWAGFPEKDVHLFFSPSRSVEYDNELLTIEDDSRPFAVVNWMRKEGGANLAAELFAAYNGRGSDPEVLEYCDFLFSEVDPAFRTDRSFEEVCELLRRDFDRRVAEHGAAARLKDYRIMNGAFWGHARQETHAEYLHYYYTKTDSTPARLVDVVANDFYVKNEPLDRAFERVLAQAVRERAALIKVLSKGGEGKSTFLHHIAKTHYGEHFVVWLEDTGTEILAEVERHVRRLDAERPLLFLLDNAAVYGRPLTDFARKLTAAFRKHRLVLVLAEREFRYENIEDLQEFEAAFNETHTINYRSDRIQAQVFDRLITHLQAGAPLAAPSEDAAKDIFLEDRRKSLTERTFSVVKYLKATEQLKGYNFDWDDWDEFARENAPALRRLYLVLATFYQFGYSLDLDFCASFLRDADAIDINTVLRDNSNLPLYRRGRHLLLRHETIASWFLDDTTDRTLANRRNSEEIFKAFLANVTTPFARHLFIGLCIKNPDFRRSYLAHLVTDDLRVSILKTFIHHNPTELKCRTELSRIYQRQKRWDDAESVLKDLISHEPESLHARTELSRIYQRQGRWGEAEAVLLESLRIDSEQLHPRTELSRIYQRQKRWDEASRILLECLRINPDDLESRTELSRIYQGRGRREEAEAILLDTLRIDSENLHARIELNKLYQKQGRTSEAEKLLLACLQIDPNNLNSLLELGKICSRDFIRYEEAERLFQQVLNLEADNLFAKIELASLYVRMGRYGARERILFEIYETHPEDIPTLMALAQVFRRFRKYRVALRLLERALKLRPSDLRTIAELIRTCVILRANEQVREYIARGEAILREDPLGKHRKRFDYEAVPVLDEGVRLLNLDGVGFCAREGEQRCVESEGVRYPVEDGATLNYNLRAGDKVFFAIYERGGRVFADFVEPYFESIDGLGQLR